MGKPAAAAAAQATLHFQHLISLPNMALLINGHMLRCSFEAQKKIPLML
jgi:hypothetical protein